MQKLDRQFKAKLREAVREMSKKKTLNLISKRIAEYTRSTAANFSTGKPYKPLKRSTVRNRKYLARHNKTHKSFKANKANLTITGQLLDSILTRATIARDTLTFKINVKGKHDAYRGATKTIGSSKSNKTIRRYLAKQGRDPIQDGKRLRLEIVKLFRKAVSKALK